MFITFAAIALSLAYHLQLPLAGAVAIDAVTALLNREIQGEIEIGRLENATWEKLVAEAVVIRDPEGREVIRVQRLAAWPDLEGILAGEIGVSRVRVRGARVTLYPSGEDGRSVSIADTFMPAQPAIGPSEPFSLHIAIRNVTLDDVLVSGDVPSYEGLRVEDMRVRGGVDITDEVRVTVDDAYGTMTGPYRGRTSIDHIHGTFSTVDGLDYFLRGHRDDDRFEGHFRLTLPDDDTPPVMDLEVEIAPVRIATIREMQVVEGLDALEGEFRGTGRLHGPVNELLLEADLTSLAGRIHVSGRLPTEGAMSFEAWPEDELRLRELVPAAPALVLRGRAGIELEPGNEDAPRPVHAALESFRISGVEVPAFQVEGDLGDDALVIHELTSSVAEGETALDGRVAFNGALEAHLETRLPNIEHEPNVRRYAPGARGALHAVIDLHADEGFENLRGEGRLQIRNGRYGGVRASSMTLTGTVGGTLPAPDVRLRGDATALHMGDLALGLANVWVEGGPEGYELRAETRDAASGTHFLLEGRAHLDEEDLTLDARTLAVDLGAGEEFRGHADVTFRPGELVVMSPLELARGERERVRVSGTYRFEGNDDLDVEIVGLDLATLRPLDEEALGTLDGRLDVNAEIRGDLDRRLQGTLTATLRDGRYRDLAGVDGQVRASLDGDRLATESRLDLGEHGAITVAGVARVGDLNPRNLGRFVDQARLDGMSVDAQGVDLGLLSRLGLVEGQPVSGRISTHLDLGGAIRRPELEDAILILDNIAPEGWDPIRAKVRLAYQGDRVRVQEAWLADAAGELGSLEGDFPFSLENPPETIDALWHQLNRGAFTASVHVAERRLDSWPRPLRDRFPTGLVVAADVTASSGANGPVAELDGSARFVDAASDEPCAARLRPYARINGRLDGETGTAHVTGFLTDDATHLDADISVNLPLTTWITTGSVDQMPTTETQIHLGGANLRDIPWTCAYGQGEVFGVVTARGLFGPSPEVGAILDVPSLVVLAGHEEGDPLGGTYRVHVRGGSSPENDALTACVIIGAAGAESTPGEACRTTAQAGDGELLSRWRVPVTWTVGQPLPALVEDGVITSFSDMRHVHLEPVLAFIPGIVSGDAVVSGRVLAAGVWPEVRVTGALDLADGRVQIDGLGQHLHGIHGRVVLTGDQAVFPSDAPLVASDANGTLQIAGEILLEGAIPRGTNLAISAYDFPIRREGMVLAWLNGRAEMRGRIGDDGMTSSVGIFAFRGQENFVVRLPEQTAATLQPLEAHTDVRLVGAERVGSLGAREAPYPIVIDIDSVRPPSDDMALSFTERGQDREETDGSRTLPRALGSFPFEVNRNDFSAEIDAHLTATYEDPVLRVYGRADILRGHFEIFGKRFALRRGALAFDNSPSLNPLVDVTAIYDIPGRTGATVTVTVTGTLNSPRVAFTSTESSDQGEIIALLLSGGRRESGTAEREASQQAASFLTGIMAGILTLGLRQEFGDFIPVLAIESEGASGTRIRAGYDANALIPDFLRGVVTGAYIEGFVTAASADSNAAGTSAGGGGVGGGVTVELRTPVNLNFRGTWVPVDNGSVDLLFEP